MNFKLAIGYYTTSSGNVILKRKGDISKTFSYFQVPESQAEKYIAGTPNLPKSAPGYLYSHELVTKEMMEKRNVAVARDMAIRRKVVEKERYETGLAKAKTEALTKGGIEATPEQLKKTLLVSSETYKTFTDLTAEGKKPVIMDSKIYVDKKVAVGLATSEMMGGKEVIIKEEWLPKTKRTPHIARDTAISIVQESMLKDRESFMATKLTTKPKSVFEMGKEPTKGLAKPTSELKLWRPLKADQPLLAAVGLPGTPTIAEVKTIGDKKIVTYPTTKGIVTETIITTPTVPIRKTTERERVMAGAEKLIGAVSYGGSKYIDYLSKKTGYEKAPLLEIGKTAKTLATPVILKKVSKAYTPFEVTGKAIGTPIEWAGKGIQQMPSVVPSLHKPVGYVLESFGRGVREKPAYSTVLYGGAYVGGLAWGATTKTIATFGKVGKATAGAMDIGLGGYAAVGIGGAYITAPSREARQSIIHETLVGGAGFIGGAKRAMPLRILESPVRSTGKVDIFETVRRTAKGKIKKEKQIRLETQMGKPKARWIWQEAPKKVKKIGARVRIKTAQEFKDVGYIKTEGIVTGVLDFTKPRKVKFQVKDYAEAGKPVEVIEPSVSYLGVTQAGTPLEGITPRLKQAPRVIVKAKTRRGYGYERIVKTDLVDVRPVITKVREQMFGFELKGLRTPPPEVYPYVKVQKVIVPETIKPIGKGEIYGKRLYKGKPVEGTLLAEIQYKGEFVKRKYEKRPEKIELLKRTKKAKLDRFVELIRKEDKKFVEKTRFKEELKDFGEATKTERAKRQATVLRETSKTKVFKRTRPVLDILEVTPKHKVVSFPAFKYKQTGFQDATSLLLTRMETKAEAKAKVRPIFDMGVGEKAIEKLKVAPIIDVDIAQEDITKVGTKVSQRIETATIPISKLEVVTEIRPRPKSTTDITEPLPSIFQGKKPKTYPEKKITSGYNVYMYERGTRVKANVKPLPKEEATRLGRDIADNSLSASFKVSKTNRKVASSTRSGLATGLAVSPGKFRPAKSRARGGYTIERRSNRLDTYGEQRGITAAKLVAERKIGLIKKTRKAKKKKATNNKRDIFNIGF